MSFTSFHGSGRSRRTRSAGGSSGSPSSTGRSRTVRFVTSPRRMWMFATARRANSSRCSYVMTRPSGPTARSSASVSAPDPVPASITRQPG